MSPCPTFSAASGTFSLSHVFYVLSDIPYTVELEAQTDLLSAPMLNRTGLGNFSGSAFVDPTITLAPDAGSQYTLLFSQGLNPVPEPHYLILLIPLAAGAMVRFRGRHDAASGKARPRL